MSFSSSPPKAFLSAPTTAGSVLTPASPTSSRDPSIRTGATATTTPTDNNDGTANNTQRARQRTPSGFVFPAEYDFPPLFTLQPNALTRQRQLKLWADLVTDWCRHHRTLRLSLVDAVDSPLFYNAKLRKRLAIQDARSVIDWMARPQEDGGGGRRAEWVPATTATTLMAAAAGGGGAVAEKTAAWIWWKRPEEWATLIADWIDDTAQKNSVLTVYELIHGDATISQEFHDIDADVMLKSLNVLVKRGKAQVFGSDDEKGVKFF